MTSTVITAAIGVGGTVIVGVVGFWATVRATGKTIQAGEAARIWEKRAAAYVDALAALHYRRVKRQRDTRTYRLDDESERRAAAELEAFTPPDWYELEGRLLAFGSMPVVTGLQGTALAHGDALDAFQAWQDAADAARAQGGLPVAGPPQPGQGAANVALLAAARAAAKIADETDDALIMLIRTELQGNSPQPSQWRGVLPPDPDPQQNS
jgi:hypothetical protein